MKHPSQKEVIDAFTKDIATQFNGIEGSDCVFVINGITVTVKTNGTWDGVGKDEIEIPYVQVALHEYNAMRECLIAWEKSAKAENKLYMNLLTAVYNKGLSPKKDSEPVVLVPANESGWEDALNTIPKQFQSTNSPTA